MAGVQSLASLATGMVPGVAGCAGLPVTQEVTSISQRPFVVSLKAFFQPFEILKRQVSFVLIVDIT